MRRAVTVAALSLAFAGFMTGCAGGGDEGDDARGQTTTALPPASPQANMAYERAFTECSSFPLDRLAAKYKTTQTPRNVARAAGTYWGSVIGGGQSVAAYGEAGCKDGLRERLGGS